MHGRLVDATWPEVERDATLIVALGSTEQHGPHLPLDTDTRIAVEVADRLAAELRAGGRGEVVVAPAFPYGASGEHDGFPGIVSIGTEALAQAVIELGRSVRSWASRLILVNGHGGNVAAVRHATSMLRSEGDDVSWHHLGVAGGDAHAGRVETAMMLAIAPASVRIDRAEAGNVRPLRDLLPMLREGGVASVAPNGVLGDPTGATAAEGRAVLERITARVASEVLEATVEPVA